MHALTQQVLREHLMGNASNHALAAATAQVRARMDEFDASKHGTFAAGRRYAPHAKAVLSHADAPASSDVAHLALQLGRFYINVAFAFADARRLLERSLSVWRALGTPEESYEVGICHHALGLLCYDEGRYEEEVTHHERSLAIYIKVHGTEEHPDVADGLTNMGNVLQDQGRYAEAGTHYERSLAIRLNVHGTEEHPEVANSLNNMGAVLYAQGRIAEAATHYERSLATYIKVHGTEENPDVAASLFNMGNVLEAQGRIAEAITHYERSLAIYIKVHGTEEHPDVARTRRNLQRLRLDQPLREAHWLRVFLRATLCCYCVQSVPQLC
jgi:tetratricopeptide (TPR) repeat protein